MHLVNWNRNFKIFTILFATVLCIVLVCKDKVFRYFSNVAVMYNDDDILTSRRSFKYGRVWKFEVGHEFNKDIYNIYIEKNDCRYKYKKNNDFMEYNDFKLESSEIESSTIFSECRGIFISKYFKLFLYNGKIVKIDMTVSMIGSV